MTRRGWVTAAMLVLAALSGCKEKDRYVLLFSHHLHVVENEMDCADCHGKLKDGAFAAKLGHKTCVECHDDIIETEKITKKTCGVCHQQKDLADIKAREAVHVPRGVFVHTDSLKKRCRECHAAIMPEGLTSAPLLTRREILRIREQSHAGARTCESCHADMDPEVKPVDHDADWVRRHGGRAEQTDAVCAVCHQEETCRECHQTTRPESHNTLWRLRTHGFEATWDRARCQVCHEEDFCVSCHQETRPRSHNGLWRDTHCDGCHISAGSGQGCLVCHETTPETHPDPHGAGWLDRHCDTCHSGSPEAEKCQLCHVTRLDSHPDPHGAGWRTSHCDSCHPGSPEAEQCRLCHETTLDTHPDPHGAGWRTGHCDSCHPGSPVYDQCVLCHDVNPDAHPEPHGAGWEDQHCVTCHTGGPGGESCVVCHEDGNNTRAIHIEEWPDWHDIFDAGIDCLFCHPLP